jgi:hypothetical protein
MRSQTLLLTFILFLFTSISSNAQDVIYLLSGDSIQAKIGSVVGEDVQYTKPYQTGGRVFKISKYNIDHIKMLNGTQLFYNQLPEDSGLVGQNNPSKPTEPAQQRAAVSSQSLHSRHIEVLYPMNFLVFGGVTMPKDAVSSFEQGYTVGLEYTNYYTSHLGFVGHLSGSYNKLRYIDASTVLQGELMNYWAMVGAKVGTGTKLKPVRLYAQASIGLNYMVPMNDLEVVDPSANLAYSGGAGLVISDLVHLGVRYQYTRQKVYTATQFEELGSTYISFIAGLQF